MLFTLQLYKLLHLLGLSMVIGGILTSFLITRRYKGDAGADQGAFVASHLVAAPGLILVIITGFLQSFLHQWVEFRVGGYMHAKLLFVVLIIACLAVDIRAQGNMRRARAKTEPIDLAVIHKAIANRSLAGSLSLASILLTLILIVFRPF